jgi:hypothetical protein
MPGQIQKKHPPVGAEERRHLRPGAARIVETVKEHDGRLGRRLTERDPMKAHAGHVGEVIPCLVGHVRASFLEVNIPTLGRAGNGMEE